MYVKRKVILFIFFNSSFHLSFLIVVFPKIYAITEALLRSEIDGAFVDSFIITAHLELIKDHPGIRIERTIEHPVTYGMVLAGNSSQMANCARRYVENYPRRVFQRIADHLKPLKVILLQEKGIKRIKIACRACLVFLKRLR